MSATIYLAEILNSSNKGMQIHFFNDEAAEYYLIKNNKKIISLDSQKTGSKKKIKRNERYLKLHSKSLSLKLKFDQLQDHKQRKFNTEISCLAEIIDINEFVLEMIIPLPADQGQIFILDTERAIGDKTKGTIKDELQVMDLDLLMNDNAMPDKKLLDCIAENNPFKWLKILRITQVEYNEIIDKNKKNDSANKVKSVKRTIVPVKTKTISKEEPVAAKPRKRSEIRSIKIEKTNNTMLKDFQKELDDDMKSLFDAFNTDDGKD